MKRPLQRIDDIWSGCPEGEIERMVIGFRQSRNRQLLSNLMITVALISVAVTVKVVVQWLG
jgi:hypothetical protein